MTQTPIAGMATTRRRIVCQYDGRLYCEPCGRAMLRTLAAELLADPRGRARLLTHSEPRHTEAELAAILADPEAAEPLWPSGVWPALLPMGTAGVLVPCAAGPCCRLAVVPLGSVRLRPYFVQGPRVTTHCTWCGGSGKVLAGAVSGTRCGVCHGTGREPQ